MSNNTINTYRGNGSTTAFLIGFDYIQKSFVEVYLDGNLKVQDLEYMFQTDNIILFFEVPPDGSEVVIKRNTNLSKLLRTYIDPAIILGDNLNSSFTQPIHGLQEIEDYLETTKVERDPLGNIDLEGKIVINSGEPVNASDLATKGYVDKKDEEILDITERIDSDLIDLTGKFDAGMAGVSTAINNIVGDVNNLYANKVDKVAGSRLMTETEGTKLAGIESNAERNVINNVTVGGASGSYNPATRTVDLPTVAGEKGEQGDDGFSPTVEVKTSTSTDYVLTITDVNGAFDTPNLKGGGGGGGEGGQENIIEIVKVNNVALPVGAAKDVNIDISGKVDKIAGSRLMTDGEGTKLAGIAAGAQVNMIESVSVDGVVQPISGKNVQVELNSRFDTKVDKVSGSRLMTEDEGEKIVETESAVLTLSDTLQSELNSVWSGIDTVALEVMGNTSAIANIPGALFQRNSDVTGSSNIFTVTLADNVIGYSFKPTAAFTVNINAGSITIPANNWCTFELKIDLSTVYTMTLNSNIKWLNGEAPDMSKAGVYLLAVRSVDGGNTWIINSQGYA